MEPRIITIGDAEVEVSPFEGTLTDGELTVSFLDITTEVNLELEEEISWDDEETIEKIVREYLTSNEEWPDTADKEWDEPRIIRAGTDVWETLEAIVNGYPVSNAELDEEVSYQYSASSQTADLKEMNLIACIGHEGRSQLLVPTHLGLKEVYERNGLEGETGLDNFFENVESGNNKEESES